MRAQKVRQRTRTNQGIGMLSERLQHVFFIQFLADALLTSDIFIYGPTNKQNKIFLYKKI